MPSISGANKIVLKARYSEGGAEHEEGRLKVAAYPGQNVIQTADTPEQMRFVWTPGSSDYIGTGTNVTTTKAPLAILKEDSLQGNTVETQYAADDNCFIHLPLPGEILQVLVLSGENVQTGEGLSANSSGKFVVDTTNAAVLALEDSGGALAADTLMRVRVM